MGVGGEGGLASLGDDDNGKVRVSGASRWLGSVTSVSLKSWRLAATFRREVDADPGGGMGSGEELPEDDRERVGVTGSASAEV